MSGDARVRLDDDRRLEQLTYRYALAVVTFCGCLAHVRAEIGMLRGAGVPELVLDAERQYVAAVCAWREAWQGFCEREVGLDGRDVLAAVDLEMADFVAAVDGRADPAQVEEIARGLADEWANGPGDGLRGRARFN